MTALFLAWYFLYVLLSVYAPDFMSTKVFGNINVGPAPRARPVRVDVRITIIYVRWADREFDPRADALATDDRGGPPMSTAHHRQPRPPRPPTSAARRSTSRSSASFVLITLGIVIRASRNNRSAADFYAGGRAFTGRQNGIAIAGDYLSAASFLGIAGAIALNGYDGFLYSIGFLVAWLVALLLVAELLRNTGKFTMADVLSFRLKQRPVRMAAAISTLAVCFFYLLAQMAGAGGLVALLLGHRRQGRPDRWSSPSSASS